MQAKESIDPTARLEVVRALIQAGDSEGALETIREIVETLKEDGDAHTVNEPDGSPHPSRLIAAHLRAAEVQIEQTHMSPAEESLEKAIYIATHPLNQAADAQLNV
jgi:hypothetical protein